MESTSLIRQLSMELSIILEDFVEQVSLSERDLLVIGCSTSEVLGEKIGTSSSEEVSHAIFENLICLQQQTGVHLAFQCCEHLNRSLVVSLETAIKFQLEEVGVRPTKYAGGAMATTAYEGLSKAVVVEKIQATAGMDIGSTFIGMHIKEVVIPIRSKQKTLGNAVVTLASRRPKLIGGPRAQY